MITIRTANGQVNMGIKTDLVERHEIFIASRLFDFIKSNPINIEPTGNINCTFKNVRITTENKNDGSLLILSSIVNFFKDIKKVDYENLICSEWLCYQPATIQLNAIGEIFFETELFFIIVGE